MWAGLDLGLSPVQPSKKKHIFNILWFSNVLFYAILFKYRFVFYVVKNINPVLKYPIFVNLKKNWKNIFVQTAKCLKAKKSYCVFHTKKKNNVLACILALITKLLKSREYWPKYQKQKKIILCCFSIRDYEFIRKTYSRYWKCIFFWQHRTVRFLPDKIRISLQKRTFLKS